MFQDSIVAFLMLALVGTYAQFDDITISNPTVLTVNSTDEITVSIPDASGLLEIYALPVGQGDCTIIQCPNGALVVNDCGSSGGKGLSVKGVKDFLGNRIGNVVAIIISHSDQDHFNYLPHIIPRSTASIKKVIIGQTLYKYPKTIREWLQTFNDVQTVNGGNECIRNCGSFTFCGDENIKFDILAANVGNTPNENSIVMKITSYPNRNAKAFTVLLSGDMEGGAATKIARVLKKEDLQSDVYKISHHGASRIANSPTWLIPIAPLVAFASSGYNFGRCHHPRCDTIGRLLKYTPLLPAPSPHRIYCGTDGDPLQLNEFTKHIHETSPASNTICLLKYTYDRKSNPILDPDSTCYTMSEPSGVGGCVIEPSVGLGDDECPVMEPSVGLEDDECCPVMEPSVGLEDDECPVMEPSL